MEAAALTGGFSTPSLQSAQAFRRVMDAMARPGTIVEIEGAAPPAPLSVAAGGVVLTLCDPETPVYLAGMADAPAVRDWIAFHTGAPIVGAAECMFAVGGWSDLAPLTQFPVGTPSYPDRSATLIVECDALTASGATLHGPGIRSSAQLSLPELAPFQANHTLYPLGLDFMFTHGNHLAALPRSTEVS